MTALIAKGISHSQFGAGGDSFISTLGVDLKRELGTASTLAKDWRRACHGFALLLRMASATCADMTPEEEPSRADAPTSPAKRPARRSRRGGRGRRRPAAPRTDELAHQSTATDEAGEISSSREPLTADAPLPDSEIEEARREAADEPVAEEESTRREYREPTAPEPEMEPSHDEPLPFRAERRDFQPASPASVTEAIDEVNRIMTSLRQVLDTMEEILETLELAEVQKTADEREIQSLRNALRSMDRRASEPRREIQDPQAPREQGRDPRRHGRR